MAVKWLDEPEDHDYGAAADYLSLVADAGTVDEDRQCSQGRETHLPQGEGHPARGATGLAVGDQHSRASTDLSKISDGKALSPILLVRGDFRTADAVADRRRLPPGVRQLPDRREHRDPVPPGVVEVLTC